MNLKYIYVYICMCVFLGNKSFAQVKTGINTRDPKATLHIKETSKDFPTEKDGILVPRVENLPTKGVKKGQLVFLTNNSTNEDDFYYWNGEEWDILVHHYNKTIDESIYVFTGEGHVESEESKLDDTVPREVILDKISAASDNDFSVKNNTIKVNKKGTYLVFFTSNIKVTDYKKLVAQTNYRAKMYKNHNNKVLESVGSVPNMEPTALNIILGGVISVDEGDELSLKIEKDKEQKDFSVKYEPFGINSLALYFLYD